MSQLKLHFLDEEQWTEINGVRVRGTAFRQGELLSDSRIADLLQRPMDLAQFRSATSSLNGYFAVVVQSNESLLAAVDRWRTWPLFYAIGTDDFYISDDAHWICDKVGCDEMDEVAKAEYIQSRSVTGSNTLFRNVNQIQAGELIMASTTQTTPSITTDQYYRFGRQRQIQDSSKDELIKEYESVLNNVFQRLIEFASGRPIAVSLSSGVDSRLIALKLVQMGYPELYSFSYTRSGQEDVAEDVASSLGINFDRISLSHREIYDWYHSEERRRFDRQSGIVDTVPNPWVAFAIKKIERGQLGALRCYNCYRRWSTNDGRAYSGRVHTRRPDIKCTTR